MSGRFFNTYVALNSASMVLVADLATQRPACTTLVMLLALLQEVVEGYLTLLIRPVQHRAASGATGLDAYTSRVTSVAPMMDKLKPLPHFV